MTQTESTAREQVRTAEVIASLCLATDLGMGFPSEHGLQSTLTAMRLCDALGVDSETASQTYYVNLLAYSGCTVDGEEKSAVYGGSLTEHNQHRQHGSIRENLVGVMGALPSPEAPWPRRAYQVATGLPRAARFMQRHFVPGIYFVGLKFLHSALSDTLAAVGRDAGYVADHIVENRPVPAPAS